MISKLVIFLWGLFIAALKFAWVIFGLILKIIFIPIALILLGLCIYHWRRKRI